MDSRDREAILRSAEPSERVHRGLLGGHALARSQLSLLVLSLRLLEGTAGFRFRPSQCGDLRGEFGHTSPNRCDLFQCLTAPLLLMSSPAAAAATA